MVCLLYPAFKVGLTLSERQEYYICLCQLKSDWDPPVPGYEGLVSNIHYSNLMYRVGNYRIEKQWTGAWDFHYWLKNQ